MMKVLCLQYDGILIVKPHLTNKLDTLERYTTGKKYSAIMVLFESGSFRRLFFFFIFEIFITSKLSGGVPGCINFRVLRPGNADKTELRTWPANNLLLFYTKMLFLQKYEFVGRDLTGRVSRKLSTDCGVINDSVMTGTFIRQRGGPSHVYARPYYYSYPY